MFALAMLSGWGLMAAWGAFLFWGWPLPAVAGGPFVWHAHELLLGFTLAAAAGFALTGVPEFTDTPAFAAAPVRWLAGLWLAGRVAFWCECVGGRRCGRVRGGGISRWRAGRRG